jgi:diguanylate cyclase (GGDEF)-like protein
MKPCTILIIDDSTSLVDYLERVLSECLPSPEFLAAGDGLTGFHLCLQHRVDLVLCDLVMPRIDGFKFLSLKNTRPELADIPVIMLTGAADINEKVKGLEAGAADYLTKPFHDQELVARVRAHLKIRWLQEELREKNQRLLELSQTDPLTAVGNRRHFMQLAELELERARSQRHELSVSILDLDYFKSVNDHYGHLSGDQALVAVARALESELLPPQFLARYGGEEFVLLLPSAGAATAQSISERCRLRIAGLQLGAAKRQFRITASFGVAVFPTHAAEGLEQLLRAADRALYRAKETGRNRVMVAGLPVAVQEQAANTSPSATPLAETEVTWRPDAAANPVTFADSEANTLPGTDSDSRRRG